MSRTSDKNRLWANWPFWTTRLSLRLSVLSADYRGDRLRGPVWAFLRRPDTLLYGMASPTRCPAILFDIVVYFKREGMPGEGKSLINTTVIVDSGTYAIVRHPQVLGSILLMSASILISQHWLSAVVGVPIIVCFYLAVVKEEKGLKVKFGDDYKRYMQKVPRMNFMLGIIRVLRKKELEVDE